MPRLLALLPLCLPLAAAQAQQLPYEDVLSAEHEVGPRLAYEPVADEERVRAFYFDRIEWRGQSGPNAFNWDLSAEFGGPRHRLWLATTGDGIFSGGLDYFEVQALYSRPVSEAGLALQAGLRQDFVPRPRRTYAVVGLQGNLTEPLYIGAFGFLSRQGEFTARLFALYDLDLPGALVLQPAFETEIAAADVPELGIGSGLVYVEGGLRLRYRFHDSFAPYLGVNWERLTGRTARMARAAGDEVETTSVLVGLRSYF